MTTALRFLADMNLSPLTVADLGSEGWDIVRVSSLMAANTPDAEILSFARQHGYVIVTQDLDFSALLALGGLPQPSVITLRLTDTAPGTVTTRLKSIIRQIREPLGKGGIVTVHDASIRIRYLPIR